MIKPRYIICGRPSFGKPTYIMDFLIQKGKAVYEWTKHIEKAFTFDSFRDAKNTHNQLYLRNEAKVGRHMTAGDYFRQIGVEIMKGAY